jgi:hypothetical protein
MIKLRLWDTLHARKPNDRQITETLKDRDADRNVRGKTSTASLSAETSENSPNHQTK